MLNVIIPLAGSSDIFLTSGFQYPKPIIELLGTTMIEQVVKNPMRISVENKFIFIIKEEDALKYHLDNTLKLICPNAIVLVLKNETKGALCSLLMTIDIVAPNDELLILNGDQIIDVDFDLLIKKWINDYASVGIVTFPSVHPRWSYALIENGLVVQTAEKNPISNNAIAGYYYFKNAKDFFNYAYISIKNDEQILDAYYISPVINQYILDNHIVKDYLITSDKYHSFYSPQMLNEFERKYKTNESI